MKQSFGARLRRERERRHISLADIARDSKIRRSLLEALERGDASHWPTGIFRRSFIRVYAEAIGLDGDATVREFLELFPDGSDSASARPPATAVPGPVDAHGPPEFPALRIVLAEPAAAARLSGRLLARAREGWPAAACDLGALAALACLVVLVHPSAALFAVASACYYTAGTLLLGDTPGGALLVSRRKGARSSATTPRAVARPRALVQPFDAAARHEPEAALYIRDAV